MVSAKYIAVVLATLSSYVLAQPGRIIDRTSDQTEIMRSIAEISHAYVVRNAEPFERVYLENYVSIRGKPVYNTRQQLIAMMKADAVPLKAGKKLDFETLSYESENPQFHFYGRTAIVNIYKKNLWQYRGSKCLTNTQATELWLKRDGAWRIAAGHVTTFQCDAKPYYPIHPAVSAIPSQTKPPPDPSDADEASVRETIDRIMIALRAGPEATSAAIEKYAAKDFVATGLDGEVAVDPASLAALPPVSARASVLRSQDETLATYEDAAIFTFRVRSSTAAGKPGYEPPKQCTLFLIKTQEKWLAAAMHISKIGSD